MASQYIDLFNTLGGSGGTIAPGSVTNAMLAPAPGNTVKGNPTNSTGAIQDIQYTLFSVLQERPGGLLPVTELFAPGGNSSCDYGSRFLNDNSSQPSIAWDQRQLIVPGTGATVDWGGFLLNDGGGNKVDWASASLTNSSGAVTINWETVVINGPGGAPSADFGNRGLSNGGQTVVDWGAQKLFNSGGGLSVDWGNFQLVSGGTIQLDWTGGLSIPNPLLSYNGDTTDGNGLASIVAIVSLTAQAASIGTTTLFHPTTAGQLFQLSLYLVTTTAGTSGTVSATIGWNDGVAARTQTSPTVTFGTLAAPATLIQTIFSSNTNITYATTVTSAIGSPRYELQIALTRLI